MYKLITRVDVYYEMVCSSDDFLSYFLADRGKPLRNIIPAATVLMEKAQVWEKEGQQVWLVVGSVFNIYSYVRLSLPLFPPPFPTPSSSIEGWGGCRVCPS